MKITVQFGAQLGEALGQRRRELELSAPCTARELVDRLAAEHGEPFREHVLGGDGAPRPSVPVSYTHLTLPTIYSV